MRMEGFRRSGTLSAGLTLMRRLLLVCIASKHKECERLVHLVCFPPSISHQHLPSPISKSRVDSRQTTHLWSTVLPLRPERVESTVLSRQSAIVGLINANKV